IEYEAGNPERAETHARRAVELLGSSPGLEAWALAVHARVLLATGRNDEALGDANEAMTILEQLGGLLQGESLPPLMPARAHFALGHEQAARKAILDAQRRLQRRTERLRRPEWQQS